MPLNVTIVLHQRIVHGRQLSGTPFDSNAKAQNRRARFAATSAVSDSEMFQRTIDAVEGHVMLVALQDAPVLAHPEYHALRLRVAALVYVRKIHFVSMGAFPAYLFWPGHLLRGILVGRWGWSWSFILLSASMSA
jgi:hypothetical protein